MAVGAAEIRAAITLARREAAGARHRVGVSLVNSRITLALIMGLSSFQLTHGTIMANLGFQEVRFPAPVRTGDTVVAETVVLSVRASRSRPGEGIAVLEHTGRNQGGEAVAVTVAVAVRPVLMHPAPTT